MIYTHQAKKSKKLEDKINATILFINNYYNDFINEWNFYKTLSLDLNEISFSIPDSIHEEHEYIFKSAFSLIGFGRNFVYETRFKKNDLLLSKSMYILNDSDIDLINKMDLDQIFFHISMEYIDYIGLPFFFFKVIKEPGDESNIEYFIITNINLHLDSNKRYKGFLNPKEFFNL